MIKNKKAVVALSLLAALSVTGCKSDADKVNKNIDAAAEEFEVQRVIKGVNAIADTPAFEVEGKCSIEYGGGVLHATCKHGPDDYRRHTLGTADNVYWASVQTDGVDADEYRTRIVIKPENLIPNFDIETSAQADE